MTDTRDGYGIANYKQADQKHSERINKHINEQLGSSHHSHNQSHNHGQGQCTLSHHNKILNQGSKGYLHPSQSQGYLPGVQQIKHAHQQHSNVHLPAVPIQQGHSLSPVHQVVDHIPVQQIQHSPGHHVVHQQPISGGRVISQHQQSVQYHSPVRHVQQVLQPVQQVQTVQQVPIIQQQVPVSVTVEERNPKVVVIGKNKVYQEQENVKVRKKKKAKDIQPTQVRTKEVHITQPIIKEKPIYIAPPAANIDVQVEKGSDKKLIKKIRALERENAELMGQVKLLQYKFDNSCVTIDDLKDKVSKLTLQVNQERRLKEDALLELERLKAQIHALIDENNMLQIRKQPQIITQDKIIEKIVEKPVEKIVEKIVDRIVTVEKEVPQMRPQEQKVHIVEKEVPVIQYVDKIVEVPVTKVVEKIIPKEIFQERIVEVPVEKPIYIDKFIDRIVEKIVEVPVERIVEKIVEIPVDRIVEKEKLIEKPLIDINQVHQIEDLKSLLQQQYQIQDRYKHDIVQLQFERDDFRNKLQQLFENTQKIASENSFKNCELIQHIQYLEQTLDENRQKQVMVGENLEQYTKHSQYIQKEPVIQSHISQYQVRQSSPQAHQAVQAVGYQQNQHAGQQHVQQYLVRQTSPQANQAVVYQQQQNAGQNLASFGNSDRQGVMHQQNQYVGNQNIAIQSDMITPANYLSRPSNLQDRSSGMKYREQFFKNSQN